MCAFADFQHIVLDRGPSVAVSLHAGWYLGMSYVSLWNSPTEIVCFLRTHLCLETEA
jgi:hypothetical protein